MHIGKYVIGEGKIKIYLCAVKKTIMAIRRFGVSLESELLEELDHYAEGNGFSNRSRAIRFLIEKYVTEEKWMCNHIVAGTVLVLCDKDRRDVAVRISDVIRENENCVLSSSVYFVSDTACLYVVTVKGEAARLTELGTRLTSINGVRHGKLLMSRVE